MFISRSSLRVAASSSDVQSISATDARDRCELNAAACLRAGQCDLSPCGMSKISLLSLGRLPRIIAKPRPQVVHLDGSVNAVIFTELCLQCGSMGRNRLAEVAVIERNLRYHLLLGNRSTNRNISKLAGVHANAHLRFAHRLHQPRGVNTR